MRERVRAWESISIPRISYASRNAHSTMQLRERKSKNALAHTLKKESSTRISRVVLFWDFSFFQPFAGPVCWSAAAQSVENLQAKRAVVVGRAARRATPLHMRSVASRV